MPDLDTFDLDAAFRGLEQHVADRTTSRGAGLAIDTARRRRRTTVGAIAAVAVLAVGGAVIGQGLGGSDHTVAPTGLPTPAPYNDAALTSATHGWSGPWRAPTNADTHALSAHPPGPRCLGVVYRTVDKVAPGSTGTGGGLAVTPGAGEVAMSSLALWDDQHQGAGQTVYPALVSGISACSKAKPAYSYTWVGAQAQSWDLRGAGSQSQHLWVAQAGNALAVVWIGGSAGAVPGKVDQRLADALVAGLRSPVSFHQLGSSGGGRPSPSSSPGGAVPSLSADVFAHAVSGWDTAWSASSGDRSISEVPCVNAAVWPGTDGGLESTSLGGNGDQEFGTFDSTAHAAAAFGRLRQALTGCDGSSYTLQQPVRGGGLQTFEASGTDVVWAVQQGRHVGVVTVPGSGTPPPLSVSVAVVTAIQSAMQGASG